jgi:hypothetical protein
MGEQAEERSLHPPDPISGPRRVDESRAGSVCCDARPGEPPETIEEFSDRLSDRATEFPASQSDFRRQHEPTAHRRRLSFRGKVLIAAFVSCAAFWAVMAWWLFGGR